MSETVAEYPARSYGCTFACGNPYDYVVIDVPNSEVMMLCTPCYIKTAYDMVNAITNPDSPEVTRAVAMMGVPDQAPMRGPGAKRRGHNAPADTTDPGIIEDFDDVITEAELPAEFR